MTSECATSGHYVRAPIYNDGRDVAGVKKLSKILRPGMFVSGNEVGICYKDSVKTFQELFRVSDPVETQFI